MSRRHRGMELPPPDSFCSTEPRPTKGALGRRPPGSKPEPSPAPPPRLDVHCVKCPHEPHGADGCPQCARLGPECVFNGFPSDPPRRKLGRLVEQTLAKDAHCDGCGHPWCPCAGGRSFCGHNDDPAGTEPDPDFCGPDPDDWEPRLEALENENLALRVSTLEADTSRGWHASFINIISEVSDAAGYGGAPAFDGDSLIEHIRRLAVAAKASER